MGSLTQTDLANLASFSRAGNRIGYWSYLADKGDKYAGLALGVVTNETLSGYVANNFFLTSAAAKGVTISETKLNQIGIGLMGADFDARIASGGSLTLDVRVIAAYHDQVFKTQTGGTLDGKAWTAELPLRDALAAGDTVRANAIWEQMTNPSVYNNGATIVELPKTAEALGWTTKNGVALTQFETTSASSVSLRNIGIIDGWTKAADGSWFRYNLDSVVMGSDGLVLPQRQIAPDSIATALDAKASQRLAIYGGDAVDQRAAFGDMISKDGNQIHYNYYDDGSFAVDVKNTGTPYSWNEVKEILGLDGKIKEKVITLDNGSKTDEIYDPTGKISSRSGNDTAGNTFTELFDGLGTLSKYIFKGTNGQQVELTGDMLGSSIGSSIGGLIGQNNFATKVTATTLIGALGQSVGGLLSISGNGGKSLIAVANGKTTLDMAFGQAVSSFGHAVPINLLNNETGSVSSLLMGELASAIGLKGFAAGAFNAANDNEKTKTILRQKYS